MSPNDPEDGHRRPRVAVIGAGVSGLVAAYLIGRSCEVTVYEAAPSAGGHAHTITVDDPAGPMALDTGFLVYNPVHYPLFTRLLEELGVEGQATEMSFSVRDDRSGLEWAGSPSLNSVFGQRRNLLRPSFWGMLRDIVRFGRHAQRLLADPGDARTVARFAADEGYGRAFVEHYLLPLGASLWSCPERRFSEFPIRFVAEFLHQHHMLTLRHRPVWRSLPGGSQRYVAALCQRIDGELRLGEPVEGLTRDDAGVEVATRARREHYDEVVCALHADDALALLGAQADPGERELLAAFPYQANEAAVHYDTRVLPRQRRCWAAWNHRRRPDPAEPVSVTYYLNRLQRLPAARHWCVTLNPGDELDAGKIVRRLHYRHPLFTLERAAAQARHGELIRHRGISYCGAYWGYGFHEDGVRSAAAVAAAFGEQL